jgi:hypothetical protein
MAATPRPAAATLDRRHKLSKKCGVLVGLTLKSSVKQLFDSLPTVRGDPALDLQIKHAESDSGARVPIGSAFKRDTSP